MLCIDRTSVGSRKRADRLTEDGPGQHRQDGLGILGKLVKLKGVFDGMFCRHLQGNIGLS